MSGDHYKLWSYSRTFFLIDMNLPTLSSFNNYVMTNKTDITQESKSTTKLVISRLFWGENIQWKKGTTLRLIPLGNYPIRHSKPNNPALRYHTASISLLPRIFTSFKAPYNNPSLLNDYSHAMTGHFHCLKRCYLA